MSVTTLVGGSPASDLVLRRYANHHAPNAQASLFSGMYLEARKRSGHQVAFDSASHHLSNMLGDEAMSANDASDVIDALIEGSAQLSRCSACDSVFFSVPALEGKPVTDLQCLDHR
jgi:hypothetical protein